MPTRGSEGVGIDSHCGVPKYSESKILQIGEKTLHTAKQGVPEKRSVGWLALTSPTITCNWLDGDEFRSWNVRRQLEGFCF